MRRRLLPLAVAATAILLAGPAALAWRTTRPTEPAPLGVVPAAAPVGASPQTARPSPTPTGRSGAAGPAAPRLGVRPGRVRAVLTRPRPVPVAVQVPALGVRARVVAAGVAGAGDALALPGDAATVAWYRHGPAPGERGSSVLAGHVDYRGERGVFGRIGELALGASVSVAYADGTSRGFRVVARRAYRKTRLPRELLFSTTGRARLALVTCGGRFDRQSGHYESNVVVFALPAADAGGAAG